MDSSGMTYLYVDTPELDVISWLHTGTGMESIPLKEKPDLSKWEKTLTKRPKGEC